jgi:hypothetical protein
VYVLVYRKPGFEPLIYIGSGTAANGLRARLSEHRTGSVVPKHVKAAVKAGYKLRHIRVLGHCPIPTAANIPVYRTITVALEAALSAVFWPMVRTDKDYGFAHVCPWPLDSFDYGGLCGHNPLMESVHGDFDFTPEQLEEIAAATRAKNRAYQHDYGKALLANPTEAYKETQARNRVKQAPVTKARQKASVESKKYYCAACNVACRDKATLTRHNGTPRHQRRVARGNGSYHCDLCNISFRYESAINAHNKCKSHLAKARASNEGLK